MADNMLLYFLISLITLTCLVILLYGLHKALEQAGFNTGNKKHIFRNAVLIVSGWIVLLGVLSSKGFFTERSSFPLVAVAVVLPLPFILLIVFSRSFTRLLYVIPPSWLVFMQLFRIATALFLWMAWLEREVPVQTTCTADNYDLFTGITAPVVGWFCLVKKNWPSAIAVAWNIIGLCLLLNSLVIAVLSMPGPLRYFMDEPANSLLADFPFIYLSGILVPVAYSLHIFSLRQLLLRKRIVSATNRKYNR